MAENNKEKLRKDIIIMVDAALDKTDVYFSKNFLASFTDLYLMWMEEKIRRK